MSGLPVRNLTIAATSEGGEATVRLEPLDQRNRAGLTLPKAKGPTKAMN